MDEVEAEISLLVSKIDEQPEDRHELYLRLKEKIGEMHAFGMPVPADLLHFIAALEEEFASETGEGGETGEADASE